MTSSSAAYGPAPSRTAHCWPSSLLTARLLTAPTQRAPKPSPPPARHCSLPCRPRTSPSLPGPSAETQGCAVLLQRLAPLVLGVLLLTPSPAGPWDTALPASRLAAFTKAPSDQFTAKHNWILMGQVLSQAGEVARNTNSLQCDLFPLSLKGFSLQLLFPRAGFQLLLLLR